MKETENIISEYEAATVTMMSPNLLKWLTKNAPKSGSSRRLKVAKVEKDRIFYHTEEVSAFDAWLKQPWPRKDGKRPHMPSAIRGEIRVEANGACAICHGHKDTCEAAHIDPVAKTDNNHPENLIWLCSNHHTAYDKGLFGPKIEDADFVVSHKAVLRRYKVMQWRMQADLSIKALTALENCDLLFKQLAAAATKEQVKAVELIAQDVLDKLPSLAPISTQDPRFAEYAAVSLQISKLAKSKKPISQRLSKAGAVRKEYVAALGMMACPLCKGIGKYNGEECPVCSGDREVEAREGNSIDLLQYQNVDCPLCEGQGIHDRESCPACGGEGEMQQRYADQIDLTDYEIIVCPVCKNKSKNGRDECRACGGEGEMQRQHAEQIDLRDYEIVNCPVCKNKSMNERDECQACGGEGEMQRQHAEQIDLRDYEMVNCPVCKNKSKNGRDECRACGGEGEMQQQQAEQIDLRDYEMVDCPVCKNKSKNGRDECLACGGEGEMQRQHAQQIDLRDYPLR